MKVRQLLQRLIPVGLAVGLFYLLLVASLAVFQRSLIYHPSRASEEELTIAARKHGVSPWLHGSAGRIGWQRNSHRSPSVGQLLILHGNAGHALHRTLYADAVQHVVNLDVFILEYPGYGNRPGAPAEQALYQAAVQALESIPHDKPVFLLGESLGTGVASYLAGRHADKISGVILIAPYDQLANVGQAHMPWVPVSWILRDRFDSTAHLQTYRGPLGVWVGDSDTIVPARFGRSLFQSYGGPKRLWDVMGGGHEDVFLERPEWWREVLELWRVPAGASNE